MADRKMTLRERARAWWRANGRSFDEALPPGEQGYLAGWHARGRADRVTKAERAVVTLAVKWGRAETTHDAQVAVNALTMALRNLARAKGRT